MKTVALLLVILNFLTGSSAVVQDNIWDILTDPNAAGVHILATQFLKPEPVRDILYPEPKILASGAIITDLDTGKILYKKNADQPMAIASLTKIMTALVVLEYKNSLKEVYTVPEEATQIIGSRMFLYKNEKMTIHNLLRGLLIGSANDAAYTLAVNTFGTEEKFAEAMNSYTKSHDLRFTNFRNSWGGDEENHYSTAKDMAKLTEIALENQIFRDIVTTKKVTLTDITGKLQHQLDNTNELIGKYTNVIGVKTGTTQNAGESLIVAARGGSNQTVIVVLLNSPNRFQEGEELLDWALKAYSWVEPL